MSDQTGAAQKRYVIDLGDEILLERDVRALALAWLRENLPQVELWQVVGLKEFSQEVLQTFGIGPQHRVRDVTLSPQTGNVVLWDTNWQELGFDNEPAIAWAREIEGGVELSFDPNSISV